MTKRTLKKLLSSSFIVLSGYIELTNFYGIKNSQIKRLQAEIKVALADDEANLSEFKSDGCSMFPDGQYVSCCEIHDLTYHKGGTKIERLKADLKLAECVAESTGKTWLAVLMFIGVRIGGVPWLPTPWRWGFGYRYFERPYYLKLNDKQ